MRVFSPLIAVVVDDSLYPAAPERGEREKRTEKGGKSVCVNRKSCDGPVRGEREDYVGCIQGRFVWSMKGV